MFPEINILQKLFPFLEIELDNDNILDDNYNYINFIINKEIHLDMYYLKRTKEWSCNYGKGCQFPGFIQKFYNYIINYDNNIYN